ncbi:MAG: AraC family transcriptional regulator [Clostridiales bacterium]|nr:AraC family transcriptional regulator [Clostridiales bacterium]
MGTIELDMGEGLPSYNNVSVKILKIGQEHCDPKKKHERRKWDATDSLHFIIFGKGTLVANGVEHHLSKGDVFLLYAREEYEYYPDPIDPWSYIWIDFHSNGTKKLFEECGLSPQNPTVHLTDLSSSLSMLKAIFEAYDASDLQQLVCSGYFILLLSELIKNADRKKALGSSAHIKQRHIRDIITYINNNFRLPLTIEKIAGENHISASRMMAVFAKEAGMSPIVYLNRFRISTACEMLHSTDLSIGEVSDAVGIDDQLYFSRMFKKQKGVSPREYRAMGITEDPYAWLKEKNIDFR